MEGAVKLHCGGDGKLAWLLFWWYKTCRYHQHHCQIVDIFIRSMVNSQSAVDPCPDEIN
jgi:hypothetical protein